jgi:hypothetical protein
VPELELEYGDGGFRFLALGTGELRRKRLRSGGGWRDLLCNLCKLCADEF